MQQLAIDGGLATANDNPMDLATPLDAAIARGRIAGAVAMVGNRNALLKSHVAGMADGTAGTAMQTDTIFQIASMTKALVSVAAMQLVERGKMALHDPIGTLLPDLAAPRVLTGFDSAGRPETRAAAKAITLHHLLTHTSGLGYSFMNDDLLRTIDPENPPKPGSLASLKVPLLFDPGERWEYGISTDWLGLAVEAASGMRLGDYLRAHVFEPLGMADTDFAVAAEKTARRVAMLARDQGGSLSPYPIEIGGGDAGEYDAGGGGLCSTGPDYLRFLQMILNGGSLAGRRILRSETLAEMSRNQIGSLRAGAMGSAVPQYCHPYDVFPNQHTGWGLGFAINPETGPNGRAAGSLAWAGIANCYYWIDPANDLAAVLLMQFIPFGDPDALDLLGAFERAIYGRN